MASKKILTVFCTEVAALAGRHQYKTTTEAVDGFLLHNESVVYSEFPALRGRLRDVRVAQAVQRRVEYQRKRQYTDVIESTVSKLAKTCNSEEAKLLIEEELAVIDDPVERDEVKSIVSRTRGTRMEAVVLDEYERSTGQKLAQRNTEFRIGPVHTTPGGVCYRLGGRVDAICDETGKVVEVKTRMNKFFLPDYDAIQVHGYFDITGLTECDFIQSMDGAMDTSVLCFDKDLWDSVMSRLDAELDACFGKSASSSV